MTMRHTGNILGSPRKGMFLLLVNRQNVAWMMLVLLIGVLVWTVMRHRSRTDLEAQVAHLEYTMRCQDDGKEVVWTTAYMNQEIRAGKTIAPPMEIRRFTCPECGKTNLLMKAAMPYDIQ